MAAARPLDARLGAGGATSLGAQGQGDAPSGSAPLSDRFRQRPIDAAPFAPLLGNDIRNVTGTLRPDLTLNIATTRSRAAARSLLPMPRLSLPESACA